MSRRLTSELAGAALNWAVAKCEGYENETPSAIRLRGWHLYASDWQHGGPIIEREQLWVGPLVNGREWGSKGAHSYSYGSTPLIAAMRCYVVSKLGAEVEVPDLLASGESL